jgi:hypothetical protein
MQREQHYVSSVHQYVKASAIAMGQENAEMRCRRRKPVINIGTGWLSW